MQNNLFDDDAIARLKDAQTMRLQLIDSVAGDELPNGNDLDRAKVLLSALRDVEKVELDIARINVTKQQEDATKANSAIMMQLILNMSKSQPTISYVEEEDLMLAETDEIELIDGEDELNYRQISFDEITGPVEDEG